MLAESDIKTMSSAERLHAMEILWRSFSTASDSIQSPDWHGDVLSERLAKVEDGRGVFMTVQELKTRLATRSS